MSTPSDRDAFAALYDELAAELLRYEETVRLTTIDFGRELLRLPIAQARESDGHFILWAGREAQPGEDVAADRAAFDQWFADRQTRERRPTP